MNKPTMLVVEDNPDHLELTLTTLEANGVDHHIVVARDGQQALDYLMGEGQHSDRNTDLQPELVLLDLNMPRMSGLQVLERMRNDPRTLFVPVIMLTSASEQSDTVRELKGGLNSYTSKPLDYDEFKARLEEVREYWRTSSFAPLMS
ncbi:MAG: response regulator [Polaromonas sp.]|uniref:response regulator n=1 Tax=Polaromonas sp. TaxID=1869339 RepID=UPI0017A7C364|nr:response regulator [Polaromonas sp.]MBA3592931.1 response regulator [Polaromonas sp.]